MKLLTLNFKSAIAVSIGLFIFCTTTAQTITTVAGGGTGSIDGIPSTATYMFQPQSVVEDRQGNIYLAIGGTNKILKVDATGIIHTYAGTGTLGFSGDGGAATAANMYPARSIGIDKNGNIYFCTDKRIRKVNTAGIISTFAGNGSTIYTGDGGPATDAGIGTITGITADSAGNMYIAGGNNRVRKIDVSGIITNYAGNGTTGFSGDGGPATNAQFNGISAMTIDLSGNIYVTDEQNHRIRKIDNSGIVNTVAGNGVPGYSGDGGLATAAQIESPKGLAWAGGYLYIGERGNNIIRQVDPMGIITTIAGDGTGFYSGDGGPAMAAGIAPFHLFRYGGGNLYACDMPNGRVRKITMPNNAPYFTMGALVTVNTCGAEAITIDTVLRVMDADNLQPITWSLAAAPAHGTAIMACNRISTGGVLTPSGMAYIPAVGYTGTDTFSVRVNDGGASDTIVVVMNIETFPIASAISGPDTICIGDTTLFSAAGTGTWSSTGASVTITGGVSATATGTATITYTVSNFCGTNYSTHTVTVLPAGECPVSVKQEPRNMGMQLKPNPSDGNFTLSLPPGTEAAITITDAAGRVVKDAIVKGGTSFKLDVAPGVYFISAHTAAGVIREKMVIK